MVNNKDRSTYRTPVLIFLCYVILLTEVAAEEAFKAAAVTGFVLSHFMNGVMDSVEVELLGTGCDTHLVGTCAGLGVHALFEIGLGVPHHVAEKFGKLGCVVGLLESVATESLGDFGMRSC